MWGVIGLAIFWWVANHAYIEISLEGNPKDTHYSLVDQRTKRSVTFTTSGTTVKKLVRKGTHELVIENNNGSFFAVTKAGGFLGTTKSQAKLQPSNQKTFIGDNPNTCMYTIDSRLLSMPCGDPISSLNMHLPATTEQPTVIKKTTSVASGQVEGTAYTDEGMVIVLKEAGHTAYLLDQEGNTLNQINLSELRSDDVSIVAYKKGSIAYSLDGSKAFIYDNLKSNPQEVNIPKAKSKGMSFYGVITSNNTIGYVYTTNPNSVGLTLDDPEGIRVHSEEFEEETHQNEKVSTEVVTVRGSSSHSYVFDTPAFGIRLCADNRLCALNEGKLEVFNVSAEKARSEFKLQGITSIETLADKLVAVREDDILLLDVPKMQGYISYEFGEYAFCGLVSNQTTYTLCVANNNNQRRALQINPSVPHSDTIDQQVLELSKDPRISNVSIYGNYIHILPDAGNPTINATTGHYEYDPSRLNRLNVEINKRVTDLGIDTSRYNIVFLLR